VRYLTLRLAPARAGRGSNRGWLRDGVITAVLQTLDGNTSEAVSVPLTWCLTCDRPIEVLEVSTQERLAVFYRCHASEIVERFPLETFRPGCGTLDFVRRQVFSPLPAVGERPAAPEPPPPPPARRWSRQEGRPIVFSDEED
jgi:hypothetical protein